MIVYCTEQDCKEYSKYGVKTYAVSKCKDHKINGMVTRSKWYCPHLKRTGQCNECRAKVECERCKSEAIYGISQLLETRCEIHKELDMILKSHMICQHSNRKSKCKLCRKSLECNDSLCHYKARYGLKSSKPIKCDKHKDENMVLKPMSYCSHGKAHSRCDYCHNKNSKKCDVKDCSKLARFGIKQLSEIRCKDHKDENMVTASFRYCTHDLYIERCFICCSNKITLCDVEECILISVYGFRRLKANRCLSHKEIDMVKSSLYYCSHMISKHFCKICNGQGLCSHKLIRRQCFICYPTSSHFCRRTYGSEESRCPTASNRKYDDYCVRCFVELFPNDPRTKTAHLATKEYIVRSYLNEEFSNVFIHNKRLILSDKDKLCTSHDRRIDFQTEVKDYIVAVEVDENQHKGYNLIDEEIRIMQIYEDADKKLVFIRFNPDNYRENGILRKTTWNIRLEALKIKINEIIDNINIGDGYNEWYTEIKMFFDTGEVKTKRSTTSKGLYTTDITKICSGITSRKKPCKIRGKFEDGFCRHHKPS